MLVSSGSPSLTSRVAFLPVSIEPSLSPRQDLGRYDGDCLKGLLRACRRRQRRRMIRQVTHVCCLVSTQGYLNAGFFALGPRLHRACHNDRNRAKAGPARAIITGTFAGNLRRYAIPRLHLVSIPSLPFLSLARTRAATMSFAALASIIKARSPRITGEAPPFQGNRDMSFDLRAESSLWYCTAFSHTSFSFCTAFSRLS